MSSDGAVSTEETLVRPVRATALGRGTQGVPDVRRLVDGALHAAFPYRVWVAGRVGETRSEDGVGLHFTLHASADDEEAFVLSCLLADDVLPQVAEVLDRVHDAEVGDLVSPDRLARVGGLLRYDALRSTLVLHVSDLDPTPTARGLQEQRVAARELVREHALPERQRGRSCRTAPLSVTLVGPADDPALARARARLEAAPYALELREMAVWAQGPEGPAALADGVREAALRSDLVLLVRDTGRPLALAAYDAPEVAFAVAQAPVPVVCGLGGQGESTATDDVAHAALPDADAAAGWVLDRLAAAEHRLLELAREAEAHAEAAAERARTALVAAREDVEETAVLAEGRAMVARHRLKTRVLAVSAVLVVALVVAAVLLGMPLLLAGAAAVVLLLAMAWGWSRWAMTRSRTMSRQDDDFVAVLARLQQVRDELATTSSPETVHRLRGAAQQLLQQGEQILGRHVPA